ncbi:MAG: hypothetical protein CBD77_02065 [bacterium TMED217]|nr:MAG: hypothetical protein CBD77_02065 [bacterium TMED217]
MNSKVVKKKVILINSISNFSDDDGSMQKIARSFELLGHEVIYIEKPISIFNMARNWRNIFIIFNRFFSKKIHLERKNISIVNPGVFPIFGYFISYFRKRYELKKLSYLKKYNFDIIINYDPLGDFFLHLCKDYFKNAKIGFYNTQDFLATPQPSFLKKVRLSSINSIYNDRFNKIIISNPNLEKYGKYDILLFGGVETDKFKFRIKKIDSKNLNVIYHGTFNVALDYDLIFKTISSNFHITFNFLGPIKDTNSTIDRIFSLKNVNHLGSVDYSKVPDIIAKYDIGFIPYYVNELTDSVTSLKLYEYLSIGMPVVTTSYSEAINNNSKLFFIDDGDTFEDAALLTEEVLMRNYNIASKKSWLTNTKKIIDLYENSNTK